MSYLKVHINSIQNASASETKLILDACKYLEVIVNCNKFKYDMEMDVLWNVMRGSEVANEIPDWQMDLNILMYYSDGISVGTANPELNRIRINSYRLNGIENICNTIMHEYCHCLGYKHESGLDLKSVPYIAGALVEKLLRKYKKKIDRSGIQFGKKLRIWRPWYYLWLFEKLEWK